MVDCGFGGVPMCSPTTWGGCDGGHLLPLAVFLLKNTIYVGEMKHNILQILGILRLRAVSWMSYCRLAFSCC